MEDNVKPLLQAIIALLIEQRSDDAKKARKDEVLLNDAGLATQDIAKILAKTPAATAKTIQRSKKG